MEMDHLLFILYLVIGGHNTLEQIDNIILKQLLNSLLVLMLGDHEISFGFEREERNDKYWGVGANGLWTLSKTTYK